MRKSSIKPLSINDLSWQGNTPEAPLYEDVYFFDEDGYGETRHVFLDGINIDHIDDGLPQPYIIVETGFGTGLNFLATWKAWVDSGKKRPLYYISIEGHPLAEDVLKRCHALFPLLEAQSKKLINQIPPPSPGHHLRHFDDGHITLLLIYDDVSSGLQSLMSTTDAWYLDGFTPSRNPEMWTDTVFDEIRRLSSHGTKLATYTAAGFVRRSLSSRGFSMHKRAGFQKKRECLSGVFEGVQDKKQDKKWDNINNIDHKSARTIVLGSGFAGAFMARALHRSGIDVTVISTDEKHTSSQVPGAILSPTFIQNEQGASRLLTSSFLHSFSNDSILKNMYLPKGLTQKAATSKDRERLKTLPSFLNWPNSWLEETEDGLYFPRCGSVDTKNLLSSLLNEIPKCVATISDIKYIDGKWCLYDEHKKLIDAAQNLVLCGGVAGCDLPFINNINIVPNRGQIELIKDNDIYPQQSLTYDGYLCPATSFNRLKVRAVGSSFSRNIDENWHDPTRQDRIDTLAKLENCIGNTIKPKSIHSWVGLRSTTIDHFPLVGPIPNWQQWQQALKPLAKDSKRNNPSQPLEYHPGLYTLTGLGSKGLQMAPLCAEIINAMITSSPLPIAEEDIKILHPGRFLVRNVIKGVIDESETP